jgi:FAD/FMN-containing dehydrogenase
MCGLRLAATDRRRAGREPGVPTVILLSTDDADLARVASDFGHSVSRRPLGVVRPRGAECVAAAVRFGQQAGIPVVARGAGHSVEGQAQAGDGIVVEMAALGAVGPVEPDRVSVGAGAPWSRVLAATLPRGLAPPVLTDHLELTVGGTVSAGGFGATSHRYGSQADNVYELDVVTPSGELVTCSPARDGGRFDAVRGTQGEHGIITRATVALAPVPRSVRRFRLDYADLGEFLADQARLAGTARFDHLLGHVRYAADVGWRYQLEAAVAGTPAERPDDRILLGDLGYEPGGAAAETMDIGAFYFRYAAATAALRADGLWQHPHPRCTLLLPGRHAHAVLAGALADLGPEDVGAGGGLLVYPIPTARLAAPNVPRAGDPVTVVCSLLRTAPPGDAAALDRMRRHNAALRAAVARVGGADYAGRTAYHDARDMARGSTGRADGRPARATRGA